MAATMYEGLTVPMSLEGYNIYRGVTDFTNVHQFMAFEGGRSFISVINIPIFMQKLAQKDKDGYGLIIRNYTHLLMHEFLGLDGLDDITSETANINDGRRELNLINKVTENSTTVTLNGYRERSGGLIWRAHDIFLTGINDSGSGFKHYYGLIESGELKKSYANEIYNIIYGVLDQTGLELDAAYLLACGQTPTAYNYANTTAGDYSHKEISIDLNCFPVRNKYVTQLALNCLKNMTIVRNSANFLYYGVEKGMEKKGVTVPQDAKLARDGQGSEVDSIIG